MLAAMRLKYPLVMLVLASWFISAVLTANGTFFRYGFSLVAATCSLAALFLVLSVYVRRRWNRELAFEFDKSFLLCGPPSLAAAFTIAQIVYQMAYRNYCTGFHVCLSAEAFDYYTVSFIILTTRMATEFYVVMFVSWLIVRLARTIEKSYRRY